MLSFKDISEELEEQRAESSCFYRSSRGQKGCKEGKGDIKVSVSDILMQNK